MSQRPAVSEDLGRPARSALTVGLLVALAAVLCGAMIWLGLHTPLQGTGSAAARPILEASPEAREGPVLAELLKLLFAALIGVVVSAVHRHHPGDKPITRSLAQAQVLLCVAGALMMIIIGDSLPRALGIAGGATIIRFRTPVDDPKDSTVLFLLLGLGMACGMGLFAVAGLGLVFLCVCLVLLDLFVERKPRTMTLEMAADGPDFPHEYVNRLLSAYRVRFEPREVGHGSKATTQYMCMVDPDTPLQRLTEQLLDAEAGGVRKVAWEIPRKA
jgi:hypothetical protein